jgi:hypothetical protein
MANFAIRAIGRDIANQVRSTLQAPGYGHPVHLEVARGTGPCRACLNTFQVGEDVRLLFTFNPFSGTEHIPQPGPVFIHADECTTATGNTYPAGLQSLPVLAEAHHTNGTTSQPRALPVGDETATLETLLDDPDVSFLHLRHAEAGCFIARVERSVN